MFVARGHFEFRRIGFWQLDLFEQHHDGHTIFSGLDLYRKVFQVGGVPRTNSWGLPFASVMVALFFDTGMTVDGFLAKLGFFDFLGLSLMLRFRFGQGHVQTRFDVWINDVTDLSCRAARC